MYPSCRTVDAHVAHVLHKLQLRSRTEVKLEAARHHDTAPLGAMDLATANPELAPIHP